MITCSTMSGWMGWNLFFPQQCSGAFSSTLCLTLPFPGRSAIPGIPVMLWPLWTHEASLDCSRNSCQANVGAHCSHLELLVPAQWGTKAEIFSQPLAASHHYSHEPQPEWNSTIATEIFKIPVTEPDGGQDVNLLMTAAQHSATPQTVMLCEAL